jgi:ELWxxDGT repeat protein
VAVLVKPRVLVKIFLTSLALLACACPAFAQAPSPRLVRLGDLNTSPVTIEPTSGGAALLGNGDLVFSGSDSEAGEEIWIQRLYQGIARRVVDFRPGGASSSPREFAPLNVGRFSVVVDDGITGPEVVVLDSYGSFFPSESGQDLCPGRDHAAPRLLGRVVSGAALYVLNDGADPFGRPGESVWKFTGYDPPLWLDTFKPGSVRQPRNGSADELYFVGQRWDEAEIALFRVSGWNANHAELLCVMGDPAVAEPLPDQVYAVTPAMVCYRGFNGSQPMLRAFRTNAPGNVVSYPLGPVLMDPSFASNGYNRICFTSFDLATGFEPWMIVDDFMGSPLTPQLVVDSNPSTSTTVSASRFTMQGNILYFETGWNSRVLKFVDTSLTNRVAYTILADSERISRRLPVSSNQLAYVVTSGGSDSLLLYSTTSRTIESLAQNVQVRELWAPANGLNAILEAFGIGMLYRLQGNSLQPVQSFTAGSARRLPITGSESSTTGWVIGSEWDLVPRLYRYPVASSSTASPITMDYQGPSNNASSHPTDFHDINGHLFLTAIKDGQRLLFHSPDGAQDSLQPVPLVSSGANFPVGELVRLGNQLFLRSAADGTLCRAMLEPAPVGAAIRPVLDGTTPIPAERLTVAAGKVFFVQVGATTETLRFVNPDLSLGTVQVFQKPPTGPAIIQMTGTPTRLFFSASSNPNNSIDPVAVWSTTGSGMPEQRMLSYGYRPPQMLGLWGGHCVFWSAYEDMWFEVFTWSGLPGEGIQYRLGDDLARRPESSHTPGIPSGIEFDERFAYCDREGRLMVLGASGGVDFQWRDWDSLVRPECLSVLNGTLVWKAYRQRSGSTGMWQSQWYSKSGGAAYEFIASKQGAPSPLRLAAGRVWSVAGWPDHTILTSWNGLASGLQDLSERIDPHEALGEVSMGTYRGRLVLSARPNNTVHTGFEPMILLGNSGPASPVPFNPRRIPRDQPLAFTFDDITSWWVTDPEADPFTLTWIRPQFGTLKLNGQSIVTDAQPQPGDVFEWTPPPGFVGNFSAFGLAAQDTWNATEIPVTIRVETPHDEWTRQHFTPQQLADPLVSGPAADADGDGVTNALEFVFGRLPHQPEGERGWSLTSTTPAAGQRRAVFTFNRLAVLPLGAAVLIEQSEDLQTWTPVAIKVIDAAWNFPVAGVSVEEVTLPDGRIETRVTVEESSSLNRFLRLRVLLL